MYGCFTDVDPLNWRPVEVRLNAYDLYVNATANGVSTHNAGSYVKLIPINHGYDTQYNA